MLSIQISDDNLKCELDSYINLALKMLYQKDHSLIYNDKGSTETEMHVGERTIVSKFIHHLKNIIPNNKNLSVDSEYNRHSCKQKLIPDRPNGILPDLIIHERGNDDNNILAAEFKGWWNHNVNDYNEDQYKLKCLTDSTGEYKYRYGMHIILGKKLELVKIIKFVDGVKQG